MGFIDIYAEELERAVKERPDDYGWPVSELPVVLEKMKAAFIRGSYNKDSLAIKRTCKRLVIKHTYKAINEAIKSERTGTMAKMVKAQCEIEMAMASAEDESPDAVKALVLKVCAKHELPIKAFDFVLSWAVGKYC